MKLMEKKKSGDELDPTYKDAKMATLQALHGEMRKMMADDLHGAKGGMKEVKVAAPDKEGLSAGLDTAKDLLSSNEDNEDPTDDDGDTDGDENGIEDHEDRYDEKDSNPEHPTMEGHDPNDDTHEALEKQIADLHARKAKLGKK